MRFDPCVHTPHVGVPKSRFSSSFTLHDSRTVTLIQDAHMEGRHCLYMLTIPVDVRFRRAANYVVLGSVALKVKMRTLAGLRSRRLAKTAHRYMPHSNTLPMPTTDSCARLGHGRRAASEERKMRTTVTLRYIQYQCRRKRVRSQTTSLSLSPGTRKRKRKRGALRER